MNRSVVTAPTSPVGIWECAECQRRFVAQGERCLLCGEMTAPVSHDGRGRLLTWTTIGAGPESDGSYILGWAELDGVALGALGQVLGETTVLRRGLSVRVRQTDGDDGWPRLWLELDPVP